MTILVYVRRITLCTKMCLLIVCRLSHDAFGRTLFHFSRQSSSSSMFFFFAYIKLIIIKMMMMDDVPILLLLLLDYLLLSLIPL